MKKKTRRMLSVALALMLGFSLHSPTPAETDTPAAASATKGTLSILYMGEGNTPADADQGSANFNEDNRPTGPFWVGVAVSNVNGLELFNKGIYSMELAFEYNPAYVRPYYSSENANADWQAMLETGNMSTTAGATDPLLWNSSKYILSAVAETDLDTKTDRSDVGAVLDKRQEEGWRMCTVCITYSASVWSDARFQSMTDTGTQLLLRLPFQVVNIPPTSAGNPVVLSLVRGPETFDIGAGDGGTGTDATTGTYAAWEEAAAAQDPSDMHNMANLFTFAGDIRLFGEGSAIENIQYLTAADGTPEDPFRESTLENRGFQEEHSDYYVSVPNDTTVLYLQVTADSAPQIFDSGGTSISVSSVSGVHTTAALSLLEMDKSKGNEGFDNSFTISDGKVTYTVHVRRLLKPQIKLNPGNSPVGLMHRMHADYYQGTGESWSDEKIQQAVDAFTNSDGTKGINLQYGNGLVPDGGQTELIYVTEAWKSYKDKEGNIVNYDLNPNALFVYQGTTFKDPGITVIDEMGEVHKDVSPTVNLSVKRQLKQGVSSYATNEDANDHVPPLVDGTTDTYSLASTMVRTDVYLMQYSYAYVSSNGTVETLESERPLIVLGRLGDIYLNVVVTINDSDVDYLKRNSAAVGTGNSLVAFRSADVVFSTVPSINDSDIDYFKKSSSAIGTKKTQYYKELE